MWLKFFPISSPASGPELCSSILIRGFLFAFVTSRNKLELRTAHDNQVEKLEEELRSSVEAKVLGTFDSDGAYFNSLEGIDISSRRWVWFELARGSS